MYFLAIGEVKGFAFTLGLTTVFDLLVSFLLMAPLMQLAARNPKFAKPSMNGLGGIMALARERRESGYFESEKATAAPAPAEGGLATPVSRAEGEEK